MINEGFIYNKGGTARIMPRPFLGMGLFCFHFYKNLTESDGSGYFTGLKEQRVNSTDYR